MKAINQFNLRMNIPQKKLEALCMLAQMGHFGEAATALGISQPTLSRHVQEVEQSFGLQIFDRHTRAVSLTPMGEEIVAYAQNLLAFQARAVQRIEARRQGYSGHVVIAALPSFIGQIIVPLLQEMRQSRPDIAIEIIDQPSMRIRELILMDQADLGLDSPVDTKFEGLIAQQLSFDSLCLVVHKAHPLAGRDSISISELNDYELIGTPIGTSLRHLSNKTFARHDLVFTPHQELNQVVSILGMIAANLGAAIMPLSARQVLPANCHSIEIIDAATRTIWMLHKEHQTFDPAVAHVMSVMNAIAAERNI